MTSAFKLRNGTILLSTEAPGGIYNAAQLKKIASLSEGDSVIIRATEDQRLALCVKPELAAGIAEQLKAVGLGIRHYQDGLHHPTSCIGELCADHEQDALGASLDISQVVSQINLTSPLKIGINGCAKCCVPCHTLDISIIGDMSGYRINLGGKNSQIPEMASFMAEGVPPTELPTLVKSIIEIYKSLAEDGESLQSVIERVGSGDFIKALAPYSQDAASGDDPFTTAPSDQDGSATVDSISNEDLNLVSETETLELESLNTESLNTESVDIETLEDSPAAQIPSDDFLDIDPQSSSSSGELDSEVEISAADDSLPDIAFSSEFSEDSLDIPTSDAQATSDVAELEMGDFDTLETLEAEMTSDTETLPESIQDDALSESKIDITDVLKQPAVPLQQSVPVSSETALAQDADLTEVSSEEDEVAYEKQLTASIAAQEQLQGEPEVDDAREQALELLGDSQASLEDEVTTHVQSESSEAFEELSESGNPVFTEIMVSENDSNDDTDFESDHDHGSLHALPLSELVTSRKKVQDHVEALPRPAQHDKSAKKSWAIAGFDIDCSGSPVVQFANGIQITITHDHVINGSMQVGGHALRITEVQGGMELELNGMKVYIPAAA